MHPTLYFVSPNGKEVCAETVVLNVVPWTKNLALLLLILPFTCNFSVGLVVPIPTFPEELPDSQVITSEPSVELCILNSELYPVLFKSSPAL